MGLYKNPVINLFIRSRVIVFFLIIVLQGFVEQPTISWIVVQA